MKKNSSHPSSEDQNAHPLIQELFEALVQDKGGKIHLPENTYVGLHSQIDELKQAKELAGLAENLLNLAINLDQQLDSEEASTHVGLLAKAAADKAISLNSDLTSVMDRISKNAAQYQRFSAEHQRLAPKLGKSPKKEGVLKLSDLDPNRRKA